MTVRDEFFWLGEINKATLVINSRQGLLPMPIAKEAAKALREVLADGDADPTKRAKTYITFEPLMLKKADPVITLMHAGRSSQDMHATYRSAILRDHVLEVGDALNTVLETMTDLADKNRETVVPNYTNGRCRSAEQFGTPICSHFWPVSAAMLRSFANFMFVWTAARWEAPF